MLAKQELYTGLSSLERFRSILQERSPRRLFIVRGGKSYTLSGAEEAIESALNGLDCQTLFFSGFKENPQIEDVEKGLSLLAQHPETDLIIGIGGGSVLDMAKLIRFFHAYEGKPTDSSFTKKREPLPLIALPTTAGTGCEVTPFAVLYIDKVKYSVEHTDMLSDTAVIYPPFTYKASPYLTACTGFDALAQAIESYWSRQATPVSEEYAQKAMELIWPNLPSAVHAPSMETRDRLSEGAYYAGKAIALTRTTIAHAFSYPFTAYYQVPHGHAVSLAFPFFFCLNVFETSTLRPEIDCASYLRKMDYLKKLVGAHTKPEAYTRLKEYIDQIGLTHEVLPKNINKTTVLSNVNPQRAGNNPVPITTAILSEALESIY